MTTAESSSAMTSDGVDFVDEDDARRVLLALLKQVAGARGAHADKHLDEIRAAHREERNVCFARNGSRQQRLSRSRRSDEQHAFRNASAKLLELLRLLEEGDDLLELFLGFLTPALLNVTFFVGPSKPRLFCRTKGCVPPAAFAYIRSRPHQEGTAPRNRATSRGSGLLCLDLTPRPQPADHGIPHTVLKRSPPEERFRSREAGNRYILYFAVDLCINLVKVNPVLPPLVI